MAVDTGTVQVTMPAMGDSVAEGTVLEWHKAEGEAVSLDETIVEISTDKVDAEVPAPVAGTLVKQHVAEGDTVAVGALLAAEGDTVTVGQVIARMSASGDAPTGSAPAPAVEEAPAPARSPAPAANGDANASPVAQRVAAAEGVDLGRLTGSARGGRITKADVLAAAAGNGAAAPAVAAPASAAPAGAQQLKGGA